MLSAHLGIRCARDKPGGTDGFHGREIPRFPPSPSHRFPPNNIIKLYSSVAMLNGLLLSASDKMMFGLFPPSSSVTFFKLLSAAAFWI